MHVHTSKNVNIPSLFKINRSLSLSAEFQGSRLRGEFCGSERDGDALNADQQTPRLGEAHVETPLASGKQVSVCVTFTREINQMNRVCPMWVCAGEKVDVGTRPKKILVHR